MRGRLIDTEGEMAAALATGTRWPEAWRADDCTARTGPRRSGSNRSAGSRCAGWAIPRPSGATVCTTARWQWSARISALPQCEPGQMENFHVQLPCRAISDRHGEGFGVFEQLILGPYKPLALKEFLDLG